MKWPETLTLVRHDVSEFNALKPQKAADPLYREFLSAYDRDPHSDVARRLAIEIHGKYALKHGDHDTPLAPDSGVQATQMATVLKTRIGVPDVIFVSPYKRTHQTLEAMAVGWPDLKNVKTVEEERIREQDHGAAALYNDWRVFNVMHPEQIDLRHNDGPYWYRYPQGENVPDVRERLRSWLTTLTRDFFEQGVLAVTHHLAILSLRANLERLGAEDFERMDIHEKPINAGVTIYRGDRTQGTDGHLVLATYNEQLY